MAKVQKDVAKKNRDEKAKDGELANLAQQVKILLSLPQTEKTIPIADKLLDASLTLTGVPSDNETTLEAEVKSLLATQEKYEATITQINRKVTLVQDNLAKDDDQIEKDKVQITKDTSTLYRDALKISADDDSKATIFHLMEGTIAFIVFCVLLRIFFTMTKTGATIAGKLP